jgi:hypothetical protein
MHPDRRSQHDFAHSQLNPTYGTKGETVNGNGGFPYVHLMKYQLTMTEIQNPKQLAFARI